MVHFERMFPTFLGRPFMPRHFPAALLDDLQWWTNTLSNPALSCHIPGAADVIDIQAFSDVSSSGGIGVCIGSRWRAWRLRPRWARQSVDIGFLEAIGLEFVVRTIICCALLRPHTRVYVNNQGVVLAWRNGRSRSQPANEVFKRIHKALAPFQATIHTTYIPSASNPADAPSRGVYGALRDLLPRIEIPQPLRYLVIDFNSSDGFATFSPPGPQSFSASADCFTAEPTEDDSECFLQYCPSRA